MENKVMVYYNTKRSFWTRLKYLFTGNLSVGWSQGIEATGKEKFLPGGVDRLINNEFKEEFVETLSQFSPEKGKTNTLSQREKGSYYGTYSGCDMKAYLMDYTVDGGVKEYRQLVSDYMASKSQGTPKEEQGGVFCLPFLLGISYNAPLGLGDNWSSAPETTGDMKMIVFNESPTRILLKEYKEGGGGIAPRNKIIMDIPYR